MTPSREKQRIAQKWHLVGFLPTLQHESYSDSRRHRSWAISASKYRTSYTQKSCVWLSLRSELRRIQLSIWCSDLNNVYMHVREHRKGRLSDVVDRSALCSGVNLHKCDTMEEGRNAHKSVGAKAELKTPLGTSLCMRAYSWDFPATLFEDAGWIQMA